MSLITAGCEIKNSGATAVNANKTAAHVWVTEYLSPVILLIFVNLGK